MYLRAIYTNSIVVGGARALAPLVGNADPPPGAMALLIGAILLLILMTLVVLLLMLLSRGDADGPPTRHVDAERADVERVIDRIRDL
jgi:hypothetical protein